MASFLKYRYPGEVTRSQVGTFVPYEGQKGFLVSDFLGQHVFVFQEVQGEAKFSYRNMEPFVLSQDEYLLTAKAFLDEIIQREIGKAVLSRIKKVNFSPARINSFFEALGEKYPNALVYCISDENLGTWIGATPEILLEQKDGIYHTMALAGTLPSSGTETWTEKEEKEQAMVSEFIENVLLENGVQDLKISPRFEKNAGPVKHLCNEISFKTDDKLAIDIAFKLHPTPAVSGLPRDESISLIRELEPHNRFLYSGMIGEQDKLYVNLRCCEIQSSSAYLYLGGGFTAQSIPQSEWNETEQKSLTLINVIESLV